MAITTEDPQLSPQLRHRKVNPKSEPVSPPSTSTAIKSAVNPYRFWFYLTLFVPLSLITLSCVLVSFSLSQQQVPKTVLNHCKNGSTVKVQTQLNHQQIEIFSIQQGPLNAESRVLIVHGAGCSSFCFQDVVKSLGSRGVRAVAIDLPGSGFSDKSVAAMEEIIGGSNPFSKMWDVYQEIGRKGIFRGIELGSEEMGRVLEQVVDSMKLAPVDLVLHDSALGLSAKWISENGGLIRSVVVLDGGMALPAWAVGVPVVREVVLGFRFVFEMVVGKCCVKSVVAAEWSTSRDTGVEGLPFQVIWCDERSCCRRPTAEALVQAKFVTHSGGGWMQEHNSEEIAGSIYNFVSLLSKSSTKDIQATNPYQSDDNYNPESVDNGSKHGGHQVGGHENNQPGPNPKSRGHQGRGHGRHDSY